MGPDLLEGDVELTEFTELDVQSIKGVKQGANGFPILLMKGLAAGPDDTAPAPAKAGAPAGPPPWHSPAALLARMAAANPQMPREALYKAVTADGTIDEQPDIDGGKQAIALIARLIGYEAQELEAGRLGETWDISLLCDAIGALRCWLSGEQAAADGDTAPMPDVEVVMASAAAEQAEEPDAASPPGDKARDTSKSTVAEGEGTVDTGAQGTGQLQQLVEAAVTKALTPHQERIAELESANKALGGELAKVKATPVPGGPMLSTVRAQRTQGDGDWIAKAAYYDEMAGTVTDRQSADGYRKLAREAKEKAKTPAPAVTA
jgi:hypothetical protein